MTPEDIEGLRTFAHAHAMDLPVTSQRIRAVLAEVERLRAAEADLAAILRWQVTGNDQTGYYRAGLWSRDEPFPTRAAAEARYLEYVRKTYGVSPKPEG